MRRALTAVLASFLLAFSLLAGTKATAQSATPQPLSSDVHSIVAHLMTVIWAPDQFAGQRVTIPQVHVTRILGPQLLIVDEPRIRGLEMTYNPNGRVEKLLVVLPAGIDVPRDAILTITGSVRDPLSLDKSGASSGITPGLMKRLRAKFVFAADSVAAADGRVLAR